MNFIKNIADLENVVKVSKDFDIKKLKAAFDIIEAKMIKPILGPTLFNSLITKYNQGTPGWGIKEEEAVVHVQKVVGPLALASKFRMLGVMVDLSGTYKSKSSDKWFLSEEDIIRIEDTLVEDGYGAMEILLQFLEENATVSVLPGYLAASNQKAYKDLFLKNTESFSEFFELYNGYLVFRILKPLLKAIQRDVIKRTLGPDLYDEFKDLPEDEFTEKEDELLYLVRRSMVYLSIADALKEQKVRLNAGKVTVIDQRDRMDGKKTVSGDELNETWMAISEKGKAYLQDITDFLEANATDFPAYETQGPAEDINEKEWGIYTTR